MGGAVGSMNDGRSLGRGRSLEGAAAWEAAGSCTGRAPVRLSLPCPCPCQDAAFSPLVLAPCYIILPLLFPTHTHVPGPCRAVPSHASPPYHAPARPLWPPGSLSRVILLPLQAHVGLFPPMLLPPLTSTLMPPSQAPRKLIINFKTDSQFQNRF